MARTAKSEQKKTKTLKTSVTPERKAAFLKKAREYDRTESQLLDWLVGQVLKDEVASENVEEAGPRTKTLQTKVNARMKKDVEQRAMESGNGSASTYLYLMIKAHLSKKPSFTEKELDEVHRGGNQLAALGRNINQIARALNTSLDNAHLAMGIDLAEIAKEVNAYRDSVRKLMQANLAAWGVEVGNEEL